MISRMPSDYLERRDRTPSRIVLDQEQVEQLRSVQVELLLEFDRICRELDLEYFAVYGTALGAVRHAGFIPWDDDLDVGMLRHDYDQLVQRAGPVVGDGYTLQTHESDPHAGYFFAKLRKDGTRCVDEMTWDSAQHGGVFIDVFPLDVQAEKGWRRLVQKRIRYVGFRLMYLKVGYLFMRGTSRPELAAQAVVRGVGRLLPRRFVVALTRWHTRLGEGREPVVHASLFGGYPYERDIVDDAWIRPLRRVPFEQTTIPIFDDVDAYLTQLYRDYRQLPPLDQRVGHHEIVEFLAEPDHA